MPTIGRTALVLALALAFLVPSADAAIRFRKPKFRGRIASVSPTSDPDGLAKGFLGTMLILGEGNSSGAYNQVWVSVTKDTKISGRGISQQTFAILATGMSVEVKLAGDISRTFPVRGIAKSITVRDATYVLRAPGR